MLIIINYSMAIILCLIVITMTRIGVIEYRSDKSVRAKMGWLSLLAFCFIWYTSNFGILILSFVIAYGLHQFLRTKVFGFKTEHEFNRFILNLFRK